MQSDIWKKRSEKADKKRLSGPEDGLPLGEMERIGAELAKLKRIEDAERDNDRIYAVLRGVGASSDGRAKSVYAPRPEGQAKALRRAYKSAGYGPETVELAEAHGTGTKAGDAAEFAGLQMAFNESGNESRQWCALGSVKSQIGHTKAAAGAAGLFKTVMALHHKVLPPTIKVDQPNPALDLEASPFYLNTEARPWVRPSDHPRRASVISQFKPSAKLWVSSTFSPRLKNPFSSMRLFKVSPKATRELYSDDEKNS